MGGSVALLDLLGLAAMISIWTLGVTRVGSMIWGLAAQGLTLGGLMMLQGFAGRSGTLLVLAAAMIGVKGIAIPIILRSSATRLQVARDPGTGIAPGFAMLVGTVITAACYFQSRRFSVESSLHGTAGLSIALVLTGLLIMLTRRTALGMLIGFLVLDNGIAAYGFTQTPGMPVVVELGVLFDLFAGVLLAGMMLFRVRRSFEHLDASAMRELRE
jgi:hydrogenase-4 component E